MTSARATLADGRQSRSQIAAFARSLGGRIELVLVPVVAFAAYLASAVFLEARNATFLFGADTGLYAWLSPGADLDRIARFHPVTVFLELGWVKLLAPLTGWIAAPILLKALFAAVGAAGVWATMWAFSAVLSRRYVALFGIVYAASLDVWFFSSIEESKIVSGTLSALYIAVYLHLRERWSVRGAVLLSAVLLTACLNEIVAGLLAVIPALDALLRRGWNLRHLRWIAGHALVPPMAFLLLETVVNGRLVPAGTDPEGASHLSTLVYYFDDSSFNAWIVHYFLSNWLFFNFAAPTPVLSHVFPHWPEDKYFDPVLMNYFSSPASAGLVVLFGMMLVAILLPRYRGERAAGYKSVLVALAAYALLRAAFFFAVFPQECLLFSSSVTLAHMLLVGVPFALSRFPAKQGLLAALALLLLVVNGTFIVSQ